MKHPPLCVQSSVLTATEEMENTGPAPEEPHACACWEGRELRLAPAQSWSYLRWPHSDFVARVTLHGCICRYCDSHHVRCMEPPTLLVLRVICGKSRGRHDLWPWKEGKQVRGLGLETGGLRTRELSSAEKTSPA